MKKIKIMLVIICSILSVQNCIGSTMIAFADEIKKENDALNSFLKKEKKNNTHNIDESVERELNSKGIFDEEIEKFDNKLVGKLEEAEEIIVKNEYIVVNESGESHKMSRDMVNEIIKEEYLNEESNNSQNFIRNVMESMGIIPITTYAAAKNNIS